MGLYHECRFRVPDGKTVVTGGRHYAAQLWDAGTGKPLTAPLRHQNTVVAVAFSPDSKTLLTGSWDKTAQLWDVATGKPLGPPLRHHDRLVSDAVAFSPDGKTVLTSSSDKTARLWRLDETRSQTTRISWDLGSRSAPSCR
jgi:eukaryotic-like serine/threonine-protein kinase